MNAVRQLPYGGKRDTQDSRDHRYDPAGKTVSIPASVDLRKHCGPVYDQLHVQSCSANALASLLTFVASLEQRAIEPPSRLFIYYNERKADGTLPNDCGSTIRTALKIVSKAGVCAETLWPYTLQNVPLEPTPACYERAKSTHAIGYYRIEQNLDHLRACLAEGYAFVFGIQVYQESFTAAAKTGALTIPSKTDTLAGGHAVMAVGYDDASQTLLVQNSLGTTFGKNGFFTMPYPFAANADLAYDFWTIRSVT